MSLLNRKESSTNRENTPEPAVCNGTGQKVVDFSYARSHRESADPIKFHLNKALQSQALASSAALKKLLEYLINKVLRSEQHEIKEYSLGTEVFGRHASFDPHLDTIVRVQVRRLRQKLQQYYSSEGAGDFIQIDIPKGSYVPVILRSYIDRPCEGGPQSRCRLAVLPFLTLSNQESCRVFADALTETLIDDFAKPGNLDVVCRTSVFIFRDQQQDIRQIAKYLNVDALLEGSVQSSQHQFRIKIGLVNAKTGFTVWSSKFDVNASNILRAEEEISGSVVPVVKSLLLRETGK